MLNRSVLCHFHACTFEKNYIKLMDKIQAKCFHLILWIWIIWIFLFCRFNNILVNFSHERFNFLNGIENRIENRSYYRDCHSGYAVKKAHVTLYTFKSIKTSKGEQTDRQLSKRSFLILCVKVSLIGCYGWPIRKQMASYT